MTHSAFASQKHAFYSSERIAVHQRMFKQFAEEHKILTPYAAKLLKKSIAEARVRGYKVQLQAGGVYRVWDPHSLHQVCTTINARVLPVATTHWFFPVFFSDCFCLFCVGTLGTGSAPGQCPSRPPQLLPVQCLAAV